MTDTEANVSSNAKGRTGFRETVHSFGEANGLIGIATEPTSPAAERPAVILLSAGLIHRVGPFRLHVEIARRLASAGAFVFRLDQSALGDSEPRAGGLSYEERAVVDGKEAMDFLATRFDKKRFVLVGLCSGAMNAHRVAVADDRVVGLVMLDGYAYRTPGARRQRLIPRAVNPRNWRLALDKVRARAVRGAEAVKAEKDAEAPGGDAVEIFAQDWPPQPEVSRELEAIATRGAKALFVYTGNWSDYVFEEQFEEMFPGFRSRFGIEVRFNRDADHTYSLVGDRRRLLSDIDDFVRRTWP